jgi:8-oxo-dGTP diphosphatase
MSGNPITPEIAQKYGERVRLRACGLCWHEGSLLLATHKNLTNGDFWAPPGGGVEYGQNAKEALIREFKEEARIIVKPGKLLFTCEFIKAPLHSVELFFEAVYETGAVGIGYDPEVPASEQIITNVAYLPYDTIMKIPADQRHGIFRFAETADALRNLTGFYTL